MHARLRRLADEQREAGQLACADLLFRLVGLRPGVSILDLGGQDGAFMMRIRDRVEARITIADVSAEALEVAKERGFSTWALKEGEPLPYGDGAFDVVFCNSVIEHVTLPKDDVPDREWVAESMCSQAAFAAEIRRVGKSYFVRTPHKAFPIEAHSLLPFVGWLPHRATVAVVRFSDRHWAKRGVTVDWNLLGPRAMRTLFPDATLHVERWLGLPKSLIAYRHIHGVQNRVVAP